MPPGSVTMLWGPIGTPNAVGATQPGVARRPGGRLARTDTIVLWEVSCPTHAEPGHARQSHVEPSDLNRPAERDRAPAVLRDHRDRDTRDREIATNSYVQVVDPAADYITITSGPLGTPLPVESAGQVSLTVTAVDSLGHALSFEWMADCGVLGTAQLVRARSCRTRR